MITQHNPDWNLIKNKARTMTDEALEYSRNDALEASRMAQQLEQAGFRVLKSSGFYLDEATIYASELQRRKQNADTELDGTPYIVLSDDDTYDGIDFAHVYLLTEAGSDTLTDSGGAKYLKAKHIVRKVPVADLLEAWLRAQGGAQ